jgi:uncharacterized protein (DUF2236 family)
MRIELRRRLRLLLIVTEEPAPADPDRTDPGLFGPGSVTWRIHADASMLIGGLRALLLQTLHPLAMAGVADHSDYRHDPLGRLQRTAGYIGVTTYGTAAEANAAVRRIRVIHDGVTGTAPDGRPYRANDPHLLGWVHATEVDSFLKTYQRYGSERITDDDADRYVAEMAVLGRLVGIRKPPASVDELHATIARYRPELAAGRQARDAVRFLLVPPFSLVARPAYSIVAAAAVSLLPGWARRMLWLPVAPGTEPLVVRPAATVLVRVFEWALSPRPPALPQTA